MVFFIFGVMFIVFGVLCVVRVERVTKRERTELLATGVVLIVFGMLGVVGAVIKDYKIMLTSIFIPGSLACIYIPIKVAWQMKQCNHLVVARCVSYNRYSGGKGQSSYAPVFRYTYRGQNYERQTPIGYRLKKVQRMYEIGQSYQIYINENCPEMCVNVKKFPVTHIIVEVMGILMLALYVKLMLVL